MLSETSYFTGGSSQQASVTSRHKVTARAIDHVARQLRLRVETDHLPAYRFNMWHRRRVVCGYAQETSPRAGCDNNFRTANESACCFDADYPISFNTQRLDICLSNNLNSQFLRRVGKST